MERFGLLAWLEQMAIGFVSELLSIDPADFFIYFLNLSDLQPVLHNT